MHIKKRGHTVTLWRSTWVRRGAEGNTHGYRRDIYVGSMPADSTSVPEALAAKLTDEEREQLRCRVVAPALELEWARQREKEARERDPVWRVQEATRLLGDAARLSKECRVARNLVTRATDALGAVQTLPERQPEVASAGSLLDDVLLAVSRAKEAVLCAACAPSENVRLTSTYQAWKALVEEVDSSSNTSLLRALQDKGWVKRKGS